MKRKDWITKSLNKNIFDKKADKTIKNNFNLKLLFKKIKHPYRIYYRKKNFFLRKLVLLRVKKMYKKNYLFNYFFFKKMLDFYKYKKKLNYNNMFFKSYIKKVSSFPEYQLGKNVFNNKIRGKDFLKSHNIDSFYIPNSYNNNNIGFTYYLYSKDETNFLKMSKDLLDEKNYNILFLKNDLSDHFLKSDFIDFNYFFNFNLSLDYSLELYKILILLHLNSISNLN